VGCAQCTDRGGSGEGDKSSSTPGRHISDTLPCLWFQARQSATVMVYFHANAEDLGLVHETLLTLHESFQVSVLGVEYPGYGLLSSADPCEESCYRAALAALRYLVVEIGVSFSDIVLLGRSLGSGPALFLASRFPVGGLVLMNAFTSVRDVAQKYMGKDLAQMGFGELFMNLYMMKTVVCPVLLIHGLMDKTVPMLHSARLFEACRSKKLLVTPEKMQHNSNLFDNPSFFTLPVIRFFSFLCQQGSPPQLPRVLFMPPSATPTSGGPHTTDVQGCHGCDVFPLPLWTTMKEAPAATRPRPMHEGGDFAVEPGAAGLCTCVMPKDAQISRVTSSCSVPSSRFDTVPPQDRVSAAAQLLGDRPEMRNKIDEALFRQAKPLAEHDPFCGRWTRIPKSQSDGGVQCEEPMVTVSKSLLHEFVRTKI